MSTTVSAKIPEELKRELEAEGVNISRAIREALEAEARRRRREEIRSRAAELRDSTAATMTAEELAAVVRADRDGR